jgi:hypothetical protein
MATTKMIAGLMGPTLLAIGIAMLVNAGHFPEMAKEIGNDQGLIFVLWLAWQSCACTTSGAAAGASW